MSPLGMSGLTTVLHKEQFPVVKREGKREEISRITMRDTMKRAKVYQTGMGEKMSGCSTPSPIGGWSASSGSEASCWTL